MLTREDFRADIGSLGLSVDLARYLEIEDELLAHDAEQRQVIERFQVQLAGCLASADGATHDPAKLGDYGWSPAYQAVLNLRIQYEQQAQEIGRLRARKDEAYFERNCVVAALARCFPSGIARTAIDGWSEDWHGCVYIDTPHGQLSWHYHDSHASLFADLPPYTKPWDGHTTEKKYQRLKLVNQQQTIQEIAQLRAKITAGHTAMQDCHRFRWLTTDHDLKSARMACHEILRRMSGISYSAACTDIDYLMRQYPIPEECTPIDVIKTIQRLRDALTVLVDRWKNRGSLEKPMEDAQRVLEETA